MISRSTIDPILVGESTAIREVRALVERVAPTRLSVLIQGPTGSGKELVARAVHAASGRRGRFVAFNVCAIADTMFEDALFGHMRGAFTGAASDTPGYLAEADQGTVFLDEIGSLEPNLQGKLLRAIEEGEFRPVGGRENRRSDFRVVSAINEPIDELIEEGRFRYDLLERLSGIVIRVPPLRERLEDIPPLVDHFLTHAAGTSNGVEMTLGARSLLQSYEWPGNVRELKHVIERSVALAGGHALGREEIEAAIRNGSGAWRREAPNSFARQQLLEVLAVSRWDTAAAAAHLGIHRATIYRRMHRFGIRVPDQVLLNRDGAG
jgi:transcriptional regulator with PAS, ATPase and Fis domain